MSVRPLVRVVALSVAAIAVGAAMFSFQLRPRLPGASESGDRAASPSMPEATEVQAPAKTPASEQANSRERIARVDWAQRARVSTDHYSLAQQMAGAALAGDTRAEYELGNVLLRCETYRRILAPYTNGTAEERIEYHIATTSPGRDEVDRVRFRREALRCQRLFSENPFAGYDLPDEAIDFRYWADRAVADGDPLATIHRVFRDAIGRTPGDREAEQAYREGLRNTVRQATFSGDIAALFVVGGMLSHPSIVANPELGYAWTVAACTSGFDCSNTNPDVGFGCVERGTCDAGQTWLDTMQRDLGAAKFAAIYANAQDIQYKIRTNDWDGLQQYVKLRE